MKHNKNDNLISDEQLLRFSDAIASGASFDKAFAEAGYFLSDKKEYAELKTYVALESSLKKFKISVTPDIIFVESLLAKLELHAAPFVQDTVPSEVLKSPYVGTFDRMWQMAARPSWKVAAPIAVMFFALSTMLGVSVRRDSSVVLSPEILVTPQDTAPSLATRSKTLVTNSADAILSPSTSESDATQGRIMLMQGNGTGTNVADTTPETLDGVFALVDVEIAADVNNSQATDVDLLLDVKETNSFLQPYDETTI